MLDCVTYWTIHTLYSINYLIKISMIVKQLRDHSQTRTPIILVRGMYCRKFGENIIDALKTVNILINVKPTIVSETDRKFDHCTAV